MSTVVLSIRVKRELKEEAERLGINFRAVIEKALKEEVRRTKMERFKYLVEEALKSIKLSEEEWVKTVKEIRKES